MLDDGHKLYHKTKLNSVVVSLPAPNYKLLGGYIIFNP